MNIHILVKPNSKHREEVVKNQDDTFTIYVKSPAIEDRANESLIKILAKYLKAPKSNLKIVKGHNSRHKTIEVVQKD